MDRFQALKVFSAVAEHGGFSAAAKKLGISPPAVTRGVAALEERLGTRLFVRTTRSVRLTESGTRFLQDAQRILLDLQEAEDAAIGTHAAPRGHLRVTAPVVFGRLFIAPLLGAFLNHHPQVTAETLCVDRIVNMMDEGLDVAVRIGELPDSSLTAIRVGSVRRVVFAAPRYLTDHDAPQHPRDLVHHKIVNSMSMGTAPHWTFQENGAPLSVSISPRLQMNTNDAVLSLALGGWGLSRLLSYQIADAVEDGRLVALLQAFEPPPLPIHIVHQEGRLASAKVRAFVDFAVERLRANPSLAS